MSKKILAAIYSLLGKRYRIALLLPDDTGLTYSDLCFDSEGEAKLYIRTLYKDVQLVSLTRISGEVQRREEA